MDTTQTDSELERRALAAYFRYADGAPDAPSVTEVQEHAGKRYVVLSNRYRTLAVYRVRNDGMLKGLTRWPKAFD